jgi:hypothetical protein
VPLCGEAGKQRQKQQQYSLTAQGGACMKRVRILAARQQQVMQPNKRAAASLAQQEDTQPRERELPTRILRYGGIGSYLSPDELNDILARYPYKVYGKEHTRELIRGLLEELEYMPTDATASIYAMRLADMVVVRHPKVAKDYVHRIKLAKLGRPTPTRWINRKVGRNKVIDLLGEEITYYGNRESKLFANLLIERLRDLDPQADEHYLDELERYQRYLSAREKAKRDYDERYWRDDDEQDDDEVWEDEDEQA